MRTLDIRVAGNSYAEPIAAMDRATGSNPWPIERYRDICAGSAGRGAASTEIAESALVALSGTTLLGFVVTSCVVDEGEIRNLAVAPAQQCRGVGHRLVQAALELMADLGCANCYLEVRASNTRAQNLYAAFGFCVEGERKDYYSTAQGRENALLMTLNIEQYMRRKQ